MDTPHPGPNSGRTDAPTAPPDAPARAAVVRAAIDAVVGYTLAADRAERLDAGESDLNAFTDAEEHLHKAFKSLSLSSERGGDSAVQEALITAALQAGARYLDYMRRTPLHSTAGNPDEKRRILLLDRELRALGAQIYRQGWRITPECHLTSRGTLRQRRPRRSRT